MTKAKEFRDQSVEELEALYQDISREIFQMRNENRIARKADKPHLIRHKKRDRARVMTVLREKELNAIG